MTNYNWFVFAIVIQRKTTRKMVVGETITVIQLPFRNANKQQHKVDLITNKGKNVKTWYVLIKVKTQPVYKKERQQHKHK